jgi:NAD(P)-dependent dehydrogenase (short-subunit alcohol dehydrogenase family)
MDLNLKGKVGVVTGSGRGIGRAIALTLANEGAFVVVNDIDLSVARDVAEKIGSMGSRSLAIKADVTKPDSIEKMMDQALNEFSRIDILINNAGIVYDEAGPTAKTRKAFTESTPEDWSRDIDLILYGTMNCTKAVISHMIERKSGRIVNISSDQGHFNTGLKGLSSYGAGKGGVIALTRNIAVEVAPYSITVNSICPGIIRTTRAMLAELQKETRPKEYEYFKTMERNVVAAIPLGRMGEPQDVANLAAFLASDAASWITGQCYVINGGHVMV